MRRISPVRRLAIILTTLAIACAIATNAALAIDTYYLVDIKAKNSRIIAKWQSIIPGPFSTNACVKFLDGLYPPVDGLVIEQQRCGVAELDQCPL